MSPVSAVEKISLLRFLFHDHSFRATLAKSMIVSAAVCAAFSAAFMSKIFKRIHGASEGGGTDGIVTGSEPPGTMIVEGGALRFGGRTTVLAACVASIGGGKATVASLLLVDW